LRSLFQCLALAILTIAFLTPEAVAAPIQLTILPLLLQFGTIAIGKTSPSQTVTVKHNGSATVQGIAVAVKGPAVSLVSKSCGSSLANHKSCSFKVALKPIHNGLVSGTVTVKQGEQFVLLTGFGLGKPSPTPSPTRTPTPTATKTSTPTATP